MSQFFHKWRNIVKFSTEFIFVIIERINMQNSTFCNFCHQKKEFDVILMHDVWMMCFTTDTFQIPKSRKYNHVQPCAIRKKDIKFFFLMTKVTKCRICMLIRSIITNINSVENFTMFLHLWKNWDKISQRFTCM